MNIRLLLALAVVLLTSTAGSVSSRADEDSQRQLELLPPSYWMAMEVTPDSLATIRAYYHERGAQLRGKGTNLYIFAGVLVVAGGFLLHQGLSTQDEGMTSLVWPALAAIGGGGFGALRGRALRQKGGELEDWGRALDIWAAEKGRKQDGR